MSRKKADRRTVNAGDVFALVLPDGRYGAIRVIRLEGNTHLVYTTPYLDSALPQIEDQRLREVLERRFFSFNGAPSIRWVPGKPSAGSIHVGNIPVTDEEARTECQAYSGGWDDGIALDVYRQWRWDHDRTAFVNEVEKQQEEFMRILRSQEHKPRAMMEDADFWRIMALLDWAQLGNDDKVIEPAVADLARKGSRDIKRFAETLAYKLFCLDTREHARHIGEGSFTDDGDFFSVDAFLYARCAVVANGPEVFEAVLGNPAEMPKDVEFEAILGVPELAWERKTGDSFDYETGCSFETYSNRKGWQEGSDSHEGSG